MLAAAAVAVALLIGLTVTVWAAWETGLGRGLVDVLRPKGVAVSLTATPTKTPRPETPRPELAELQLEIVTPIATPVPATPAAQLQGEATPQSGSSDGQGVVDGQMPPLLIKAVRQYGIDPSRRFIVVDVSDQMMYVWDSDERLARTMPVSTGDETRGYRTPAWYGLVGDYWGTFQTHGVYADEGWYLFQDAGSILVHGAPYELVDGEKVYEEIDALGNYPASRGCIRLAPEDAVWFSQWEPKGVPLVILPKSDEP